MTPLPRIETETDRLVEVSPVGATFAELLQKAQLGEFDEALATLAAAPTLGAGASKFASDVRDVVAFELTRRAAHVYAARTPRAVHALGISALTSEKMAVDIDQTLHLISERVPDDDAIGEELYTACGQRLWSDLEAPLQDGMRGSWKVPNLYKVRRCNGCAEHADEFAETSEVPGDANLPPAVAQELTTSVSTRVCATVSDQMEVLAPRGAVPALDATEQEYERALIAELAVRTRAGGDETLQRVLMRYYASARRQLDSLGYTGALSDIISERDWRDAVANTLDDLEEADNGAVAQSYLYGELRSVLGERIRDAQRLAALPVRDLNKRDGLRTRLPIWLRRRAQGAGCK